MLVHPTTSAPAAPLTLTRPGLFETSLVPITMFVLLYGTPPYWFINNTAANEGGGAPITTAATIGLTFFAFLRIAGSFDLMLRLLSLVPPLVAFIALSVSSIVWSADIAITTRRAVLLVSVLAYACYLLLRFELPAILRLLALSSIPGVLANYVLILALPQYGTDVGGRWIGVFSQKNALGFSAAVTIPLLIILAGSDRSRRLMYYLLALMQAGLLIGSQSKTMLVATILPVALLPVFHGFRGRKTLRGAVIVSLAASGIFTLLFVTANLAFIAEFLDKDVTLTGRTDLWADLIPIALRRPVLGYGADAVFGGYFSPVHEVWIQNRWAPTHAHNAILQTTLEVGVVGAGLFLLTFFATLGGAIEVVRRVPGRIGLWPLSFMTTTLLISISESGVMAATPSYLLFVICVWSVALLRSKPITYSWNEPDEVRAAPKPTPIQVG